MLALHFLRLQSGFHILNGNDAFLKVCFFPLLMTLSANSLLYLNTSSIYSSQDLPGVAPEPFCLRSMPFRFLMPPIFLTPVSPTSVFSNEHNLMPVCHMSGTCSSKYFWQENSTRQHKSVAYSSLHPLTLAWFVHSFTHSFVHSTNTSFLSSVMCQVMGIHQLTRYFLWPL